MNNLEYLIKFKLQGADDWQIVTVPDGEELGQVMKDVYQWYVDTHGEKIVVTEVKLVNECYYDF